MRLKRIAIPLMITGIFMMGETSSIFADDKPVETSSSSNYFKNLKNENSTNVKSSNDAKQITKQFSFVTKNMQDIQKEKINIQKIITDNATLKGGKPQNTIYSGVNGAHFVIYDITDLLKDEVNGKNTLNDYTSLLANLNKRAGLIDPNQLKEVYSGNTAKIGQTNGIIQFDAPIKGQYHAYYVVNDKVPKDSYVEKSSPFTLITPIFDDDGGFMKDVWVYPKGNAIDKPVPKPQPKITKEPNINVNVTQHQEQSVKVPNSGKSNGSTSKLYQTGASQNAKHETIGEFFSHILEIFK